MAISKVNTLATKAFAVVDSRLDKPKGALYIVQPHAALAIFGERETAEEFIRTTRTGSESRHAKIKEVEFSLF